MSKGWKKIQYTLVHWGEYHQKSFTLEHIFISSNPLEFENLLYRKIRQLKIICLSLFLFLSIYLFIYLYIYLSV